MRRYALQASLEAASSAGAGHAPMVIVSIGDQKGILGKIAATAADELAGSTQLGDMAYATLTACRVKSRTAAIFDFSPYSKDAYP